MTEIASEHDHFKLVDLPIENGHFPYFFVGLPEGKWPRAVDAGSHQVPRSPRIAGTAPVETHPIRCSHCDPWDFGMSVGTSGSHAVGRQSNLGKKKGTPLWEFTMWGLLLKSWFITPITVVYDGLWYLKLQVMGFINYFITGGPHTVW